MSCDTFHNYIPRSLIWHLATPLTPSPTCDIPHPEVSRIIWMALSYVLPPFRKKSGPVRYAENDLILSNFIFWEKANDRIFLVFDFF